MIFWVNFNFPLHHDENIFYQRHEDAQEQRLKERCKYNFQTKNKTRLCNSKTKT